MIFFSRVGMADADEDTDPPHVGSGKRGPDELVMLRSARRRYVHDVQEGLPEDFTHMMGGPVSENPTAASSGRQHSARTDDTEDEPEPQPSESTPEAPRNDQKLEQDLAAAKIMADELDVWIRYLKEREEAVTRKEKWVLEEKDQLRRAWNRFIGQRHKFECERDIFIQQNRMFGRHIKCQPPTTRIRLINIDLTP